MGECKIELKYEVNPDSEEVVPSGRAVANPGREGLGMED